MCHEGCRFDCDGKALAGSTLTMIEAVRRSVQLAGASLVNAVRMASLNPARQLGREHELGSIERGKRADWCGSTTNSAFAACGWMGICGSWRSRQPVLPSLARRENNGNLCGRNPSNIR